MARRVVESATLRGHDACARLRVFAVARGTKASQRIYDVYVGNAGSEHYPRGWARRRAVMQKRVRRLPDVLGRTQQSPPPNHPVNVGLTRLGGRYRTPQNHPSLHVCPDVRRRDHSKATYYLAEVMRARARHSLAGDGRSHPLPILQRKFFCYF